jgi:hypothetical protein
MTTERVKRKISAIFSADVEGYSRFLAHLFLTLTYSQLGREEAARAQAAEVLRINLKFRVEKLRTMSASKNRARVETGIDALRKAGLK